jgi:protein tyrosine/serine phosphatase
MKQLFFRAPITVLAFIFSLVAIACSPTPQSNQNSNLKIENFGCINANYYRGAQPDKRDLAELHALGVRTIIDLQIEGEADEQKIVETLGMKFYRIGMTAQSAPTPDQVAEFLTIVDDPASQPVFVHCAGGRHRTGMMTAIYRLTHDGWTADRAYEEMKQYEFEKGFGHDELKDYLYEYENQLALQDANDPLRFEKAASATR